MKTQVRFYKQGQMFTANPNVYVSYEEIKAYTNDSDLRKVIEKQKEYDNFCKSQTKTGQARKNERRKARKQIFKDVPFYLIDNVWQIKEQEKERKLKTLPFVDFIIYYDGRKKRNLSKFIQAVEMDVNVGGISPQYFSLGFRGYKIKEVNF
jgi:hypothetical protein